jgi:hypothetical protein
MCQQYCSDPADSVTLPPAAMRTVPLPALIDSLMPIAPPAFRVMSPFDVVTPVVVTT